MKEESFKSIEEPKKEEINLPNLKQESSPIEETLTKLPEWNIEPPVEINRGQNDIR